MKRRWKLLCLVLLAGALLLLYDRNPITAEQLMDWQPQILVGHLYPGYGAFGLNLQHALSDRG